MRWRIPGWLIVLAGLLLAAVIAERVQAETINPSSRLQHHVQPITATLRAMAPLA
jgi:hypothetical protein